MANMITEVRTLEQCVKDALALALKTKKERDKLRKALADMLDVYDEIEQTLSNNGVGWNHFRSRQLNDMFEKVGAARTRCEQGEKP